MSVPRSRILDLMKVRSQSRCGVINMMVTSVGSMQNLLDDFQPRGSEAREQSLATAIKRSSAGSVLSQKDGRI